MMMSSFPVSPTTSRLTKTNKHGNDLTQSHHCLSTWKRHKGSMTQLDKRLVLSINPLLANLPPSPAPSAEWIIKWYSHFGNHFGCSSEWPVCRHLSLMQGFSTLALLTLGSIQVILNCWGLPYACKMFSSIPTSTL